MFVQIKALACLLEKRNPSRVKVTVYGKSIEGRDLLQVKVGLSTCNMFAF